MASLIINVGGRLDKSYENALIQAAAMAKKQERRMQQIASVAPNQLELVNRALAKLPAESLMRPRLEAMKATLTDAMARAGSASGQSFLMRMLSSLGGHEGKMGMMQLVHTMRASFDAIVAGISPWRVIAYEAPQALQAITLMGGTALKVLMGVAAVAGSIAAIIGAPFLYMARVSGIAASLSKFRLPDLNTDYISRVDQAAESWRKIRDSIRDTVTEWNSATAAAKRANDAMQAQFQLQADLDAIAKERAVERAAGNPALIAQIEKQYELLKVQREGQKLDAEKAAKEKERAALEKEIAEKRNQIDGIGLGSDSRHNRNMDDLKAEYEAAKKFIAETNQEKTFKQRLGIAWDATWQGGLFNPIASKRILDAQEQAKQSDLDRARMIVKQYIRLSDLEDARNAKVEARNKLQADAEKNAKRYAELTMEITNSDKERARILGNMQALGSARSGQINQSTFANSQPQPLDLTANQRIGAHAYGPSVTLVDLTRNLVRNSAEGNQKLGELVKQGRQTSDINAPFIH